MKLKHIIFGISAVVVLAAQTTLYAQDKFTIEGSIGKENAGKVKLFYTNQEGKNVADSTTITAGVFKFTNLSGMPGVATLVLNPDGDRDAWKKDQVQLYIDLGKMIVKSTDSLKYSTITGKSNIEFRSFLNSLKPLSVKERALLAQLATAKKEGNADLAKKLAVEIEALYDQREEAKNKFIAANPDSYPAFELWSRKVKGVINLEEDEPGFNHFSKNIRASFKGRQIGNKIAAAKKLDVGKIPYDFTLPDVNEKQVSLSSLKGKKVLMVFYNQYLVGFDSFRFQLAKISKQLKDSNLVVLAVYIDREKKGTVAWNEFLINSGMTGWINVIDKAGYDGELTKQYDLQANSTPTFLINEQGKIVSRNINLWNKESINQIKPLLAK